MSSEAEKLGKTGERMVPSLHKGSLMYAEHLLRYQAITELVASKTILDIASGSGYGSNLLATTASKVYGVDVDKGAIAYAKKHYGRKNIEFLVGDGERIPLDDHSVDVVVTFETIEHIRDYEQFLDEVKRVLKPNGLAIVSTPNDLEFAEGNHYHLHEFEEKELDEALSRRFKNRDFYYQATWKQVAIGSKKEFKAESFDLRTLNYAPPKDTEYLYFYALCSNRPITETIQSAAILGEHYSDRYYIGVEMQHEQNLSEYKQVVEEQAAQISALHAEKTALQARLDHILSIPALKVGRKVQDVARQLTHRKK